MKLGYLNQQVYGETLLERLAGSPHAGALRKPTAAFKAAHGQFGKALDKVAAAQERRDAAIAAVAKADDRLDPALIALADRLVGVGLGKRQNPFAAYSRYSPSVLTELGYAAEAQEAQALLGKLRKKSLSAEVTAAIRPVAAAAAEVTAALKAVSAPQAEYVAAMQERDELLLALSKTLSRLKRQAAVAYDEDRAGYRALFAPPSTLQSIKTRPRKKPPKPRPAPPTPTP